MREVKTGTGGAPLLALFLLLAVSSCGGGEDGQALRSAGECSGCHASQVAAWANFSSHRGIYGTCTFCHQEASPAPGEGHRTSPWCDQCHSEANHPVPRLAAADAADAPLFTTCTTCHNPMGSRNIFLIRERVLVEEGVRVPVDFRVPEGRADYGHAELAAADGGENGLEPGAGICECCHASTRYYNREGTGERHARARCTRCHDHAIGFQVETAHDADDEPVRTSFTSGADALQMPDEDGAPLTAAQMEKLR